MLHTRIPGVSGPSTKMVPTIGLLCSLVIILIFSTVFYYSLATVIPDYTELLHALLVIAYSIAILFIGLQFGKRMASSTGKREVKLFREFVQHLHRAQTDEDIYAVLFDYLQALPLDIQVFLSFLENQDEKGWTTLTNASSAVCTANPGECPLYRTGGCYRVADIRGTPHCHHLSPEDLSGSCYCINITGKQQTKSLLQIYSPQRNTFDHETIATLNSYIEVTRLLINNRKCLNLLNRKVHTDKLTGLYNRYFLDQYLKNQIEASMLSGQPLSLILIDIDNFKKVNDTYGHHAGDFLLSCFSEIVVSSLRKSDAMVRYGGDEFIIILPCTDTSTAYTIVERLRKAVSKTEFPKYEGIRLPKVTCSFGISSFPNPAMSAEQLIRQADKALYRAKNNGCNKSCVYM